MLSFDDRSHTPLGSSIMPMQKPPGSSTRPLTTEERPPTFLPSPSIEASATVPLPVVSSRLAWRRSPGVTRILSGELSDGAGSVPQRSPVVIKGELKRRPVFLPRPPREKRRLVFGLLGVFSLFLISGLTLFLVTPLGRDLGILPHQSGSSNLVSNNGNNNPDMYAQATALYNYQTDGYDPYSNGNVSTTSGGASLNWPLGQCTYWANSRYHALTGYWVAWRGDAYQWVDGARMAGWNVSQTPPTSVASIIVLMPGVQGASYYYGHVAVVEAVLNSTTVSASNMNWGYGGWDSVETVNFNTGDGVWFVWHK